MQTKTEPAPPAEDGKTLVEEITEATPFNPTQLVNDYTSRDALDPDVLGKLLDLKERYDREEARKKFVRALAAAQSKMLPILRKNKSKTGKGGDYKWTSLAAAVQEILPVFNSHGFSVAHSSRREGPVTMVITTLEHESGHSRSFELPLEVDKTGSKSAPQAVGSGLTYARRYGLGAVCGFATADMDDADEGPFPARDKAGEEALEHFRAVYRRRGEMGPELAAEFQKAAREALRGRLTDGRCEELIAMGLAALGEPGEPPEGM
jgi:hypothetical protein